MTATKLDLDKVPSLLVETARQALGLEADDAKRDNYIADRTPKWLIQQYAQWMLGDKSWGTTFYDFVEELTKGTVARCDQPNRALIEEGLEQVFPAPMCSECHTDARRPKCMFELGGGCPRHEALDAWNSLRYAALKYLEAAGRKD
jgi:hypothetical protein